MITVPLWDVLEHYGWQLPADLERWQSIRCHIHGESRASCRANSALGYVACLACGFKGDAITIIMHYEGVEFKDAIGIAEGIVGSSNVHISNSTNGNSNRSVVSGTTRDRRNNGRYVPPRLKRRS